MDHPPKCRILSYPTCALISLTNRPVAPAPRDRGAPKAKLFSKSAAPAATVYSAIDLRTHCSITSAIWSEFFSSIIIWPLP
jgi:hypothetical protein